MGVEGGAVAGPLGLRIATCDTRLGIEHNRCKWVVSGRLIEEGLREVGSSQRPFLDTSLSSLSVYPRTSRFPGIKVS
jgi:hypothetical protein